MRNLKIYKASAGSGKTYTLAKEYISILLASNDIEEYRHTLAVTFTNKATDEMKSRIIKELSALSTNPAESPFVKDEKPLCGNSPQELEQVKNKSGRILTAILNDYSSFNVCTIDKFFQGIMRSFAKEFGHQYRYNIELDENSILEMSIDAMYSDLDKEESRELLEWLISYALSKVENAKGWDTKEDITEFSKVLLKEMFAEFSSSSEEPSDRMKKITDLRERLAKARREFEDEGSRISARANNIVSNAGKEWSDFRGGSRTAFNMFGRILTRGHNLMPEMKDTFRNLEDISNWCNQRNDFSGDMLDAGLMDAITDLIKLYDSREKIYNTAVILEKYSFVWGVLGMVRNYLTNVCSENNIVLLSESAQLLSRIIDGSQTPFIYEKVGTHIRHFLLDEFQDTSNLQWKNFIPLLDESISNGKENLVVGDVKQSIYRWRNSNWSILGTEVGERFKEYVQQESLDTNYRSLENIVKFNYSFFKWFSQNLECVEIEDMYSNCKQKWKDGSGEKGYVEVSFNGTATDNADAYCQDIVEKVKILIEKGYQPAQIGVLTWKNYEGEMVAKALMNAGISVATTGTLTIGSNASVCTVIDSLKEIEDNDDILRNAGKALFAQAKGNIISDEEIQQYKEYSLYQMAESIIRNNLDTESKNDSQFLCSLLDMILEFSRKRGGSVREFLKWWEESGRKETISSSPDSNAVNIVTIHKSKGLAFDAVIVPFFEWKLKPGSKNTIWSTSPSKEFSYDQPVSINYSEKLGKTLFEEEYLKENREHKADLINLGYVAFTRAKSALIIMCQRRDEVKEATLTSDILFKYMAEESVSQESDKPQFTSCNGCYTYGELTAPEKEEKEKSCYSIGIKTPFSIPFNTTRNRTALTNGSINDEGISIKEMGIQMHDAFATIEYLEDIETIESEETRKAVIGAIDSVKDYGWFWRREDSNREKCNTPNRYNERGSRSVVNERSIISPEGEVFRPDRIILYKNETGENCAIVVDYKFGHYKGTNTKYVKQVQGYMNLLKETGCKEVTGYLWYVNSTVEEVKLN